MEMFDHNTIEKMTALIDDKKGTSPAEYIEIRYDTRADLIDLWAEILEKEADDTLRMTALRMLDSKESRERQTGAIICGQLRIREALPKLKGLLSDENSYTTNVPKKWTRVYFVRKAAKKALEDLGETANNIVVEELDH